jgi:hypothetical protein
MLCARIALLLRANQVFPRWLDGHWIYVAGVCWAHDRSPYDVETFYTAWRESVPIPTRAPFLYPPTLALVSVPLSAFPWEIARHVIDALNVLSLVAVLAGCAGLLRTWKRERLSAWEWAALGAAALMSSHGAVIHIGQTGLFALAGALGALYFGQAGRSWLAAGCVVVATIKPQLTVLLLLWALIQTDWRPIAAGLAAAALLSIAIVGLTHEGSIFAAVQASAAGHMARPHNALGNYSGFYALLEPFGLRSSAIPIGTGIGLAAAAAALWAGRREGTGLRIGSALAIVALTGFLLPIHTYDHSVYALLIAALPILPLHTALALVPGLLLIAWPSVVASVVDKGTASAVGSLLVALTALLPSASSRRGSLADGDGRWADEVVK